MKQFRDKLFPQGILCILYKSDEGCYFKMEVRHILLIVISTPPHKYSYI
jgi:hypothetical protein